MIVTNQEFFELSASMTVQFRNIAKDRVKANPKGKLTLAGLDKYISMAAFTGNHKDAKLLKTLRTLHTSGELNKLRVGSSKFDQHRFHIKKLVAQKVIPFDMNDYVIVKDTGAHGAVMDYNEDTNEYLIALNPFQLVKHKPSELMRGKVP